MKRIRYEDWAEYTIGDTTAAGITPYLIKGPGQGLANDDDFVQQATARANALIKKYRGHYTGDLPSPIPEFAPKTPNNPYVSPL